MSNKAFMINRRIRLSFIEKGSLMKILSLVVVILIPIVWFGCARWDDLEWPFQVFGPIVLVAALWGILMVPFNGFYVSKRGRVVFVPDIRIKKTKLDQLKRIALTFNEQENGKYSATVKLVFANGKIFQKDYSDQFRNAKNKYPNIDIYTVHESRAISIANEALELSICNVTFIDRSGKITHQVIQTEG